MHSTPHHPTHWLGVALVTALALLAFEAAGQQPVTSPNASAVFQGRPAMSGPQAGIGAMAGPPQGGMGLQGSDGAGINVHRPRAGDPQASPLPATACADTSAVSAAEKPLCLPDVRNERLERRATNLGIDPQQR